MVELTQKIEKICKEHFNDKKVFCKYDFNKINLNRTARSELVEENLDFENEEFKALKTIFEFIFEDFEGSPNKKKLWETIYTFPNEDDVSILHDNFLDNRKPIETINTTNTDCYLFINSILNRANSSKNNTFSEVANSKKSKFFVVGDIGVGKTTFFKYLYSTYFEKIFNSNCFFLHIDFSIEFYQKLSISDSIKHEAARIFRLDYFDKMSDLKKEELKLFLGNYYSSDQKDLQKDYMDFAAKPDPQDFKPYSNLLQKGLINFIEKEYGVIYVIDGLDKLNSFNEFLDKYEEVNTIISTSRRKGLFIFVMRYDSHNSYHKNYVDDLNNAEQARPFGKVFRIEEAKLQNIISKRLNLLIQSWESVIDIRKNDIFINTPSEELEEFVRKAAALKQKFKLKINIDAITSYFNIFLLYLQHGIALDEELNLDEWDQIKSISKLKDLVGNNFRNLMDAINVVHEAFLAELNFFQLSIDDIITIYNQTIKLGNGFLKNESSLSDKFRSLINRSYKVIPLLLRARNSYLHPFYYQFSSVKNELVRMGNYDPSKFLYNIFYPINSIDSSEQQYTILLKIRIIQFLQLLENDHDIIKDKEHLCSIFQQYFHYDYQYVNLAIEELLLTRLIRFDITEYGYSIIASRTGKNHITNLLHNFGYYRIILSDTLIPKGFEKSFVDPNPSLYNSNRSLWILNQIPRISLFILLLNCVEHKEWELRPNKKLAFEKVSDNVFESLLFSITKMTFAHDITLEKLSAAFRNLSTIIPK